MLYQKNWRDPPTPKSLQMAVIFFVQVCTYELKCDHSPKLMDIHSTLFQCPISIQTMLLVIEVNP